VIAALIRLALLLALPAIRFENVAAQAGLTQSFPNGGETSKEFIIETTGSGVAFIDYDNDGLLDVFIASGPGNSSRLYHNEGAGRFKDVTDAMGLKQSGWAQGVCAGDYDNDGYTDLFVTYWGGNRLYRNVAGRRFEDVTARAHLTQDRTRYNTGCAFLDYDNDGRLDLFVANYLKFDPKTTPKPGANPYCYYREIPVNCGPRGLPFDRNILYHANADGTFTDVSVESGIAAPSQNYSLGVLTGDFNNDGLIDIYVACDQTPSLLYINQGNGKFEEEGLLRGVAFDSNGKALSGMGATAADSEAKGRLDIFRTNFSDERETLYREFDTKGNFEDVTIAAGLARNTRFVGWGCGFFDFDNDGWKDLLIVNGHVFPEVEKLQLDIHYKDRAILYRNLGNGKFEDISESAGPGILERHSSRGAAFGDYDNDGRVEVLINNQNEPPSLLKQTVANANHWVLLKLTGTRSNRSAIGAKVRLAAGGRTQLDEVRSGGSYLSQNDLRLHFGLGSATKIDRIEIAWPSGLHQVEHDVPVDRIVSLAEPSNVAERLAEAQLLFPARPSEARQLFEQSLNDSTDPALTELLMDVALDIDPARRQMILDRSPQPEAAYAAAIRHYALRADFAAAEQAAVQAASAGFVAFEPTQALLNRLYARRDSEASALFSELLTCFPTVLTERQMHFLAANMRLLAPLDPALSVQIAERLLNSNPPQGYRYAAGAYLAVFNRTKFIRLDNLFDCCRESLRTMDRAGLAAVDSTIAPFPAGSATLPQRVITPRLEARAEELRTTSAKLLALASGRVTLVHFWASWCAPCRREQPILDQLASKLQDRGLAVVGVNVDTAQPIQQQFEIGTLPVTLVFNRAGDLVTRLTGEQSESDFLRALEPLLLP
jgi:thiol-disulfide isomerase/thioredoxin